MTLAHIQERDAVLIAGEWALVKQNTACLLRKYSVSDVHVIEFRPVVRLASFKLAAGVPGQETKLPPFINCMSGETARLWKTFQGELFHCNRRQ